MPRVQKGYRCSECGWQSAGYTGRCQQCGAWNTLEAFTAGGSARTSGRAAAPSTHSTHGSVVRLHEAPDTVSDRLVTAIPELDRVLGGGIVPGSLVLVGGEPGIGKSTLVLQAAASIANDGAGVAYICGEESPSQVRMRAARLGVEGGDVALIAETELDIALSTAENLAPRLLIVDSVQSIYVYGVDSRAGGPAQLAEAGTRLLDWAKRTGTAVVLTGHVTKTGDMRRPARPRAPGRRRPLLRRRRARRTPHPARHQEPLRRHRRDRRLRDDRRRPRRHRKPQQRIRRIRRSPASGCALTVVVEGSRPIAVELQALAVSTHLASPRRVATGIETAKLHLLLAVLARRAGVESGDMDIVATAAGGLRFRDPSADLALAVALASAVRDCPSPRAWPSSAKSRSPARFARHRKQAAA
ncbi:MAG: AAA family ATPase [Dehalococcoidia bacterium]|nr:AAA family ATPase [Dehalococcoidia bacterium]